MTKTVMILEDDPKASELFGGLIKSCGHNVVKVASEADVVDSARRHQPNLIVMDVNLPEARGFDLITAIKSDEVLQSIPVIAVTSFVMEKDRIKIRKSGCDAYLLKPISVPEFMETVTRLLN